MCSRVSDPGGRLQKMAVATRSMHRVTTPSGIDPCGGRLWHNRNIPVLSFQLMKLLNTLVTFTLVGHILQYYSIEFDLLEVRRRIHSLYS